MSADSTGLYDALGQPVPEHRLTAAYRLLKGWNVPTEDALRVIGRVAHYIEQDEPYKAQRICTNAPLDRAESSPEPPFPYPDDLPDLKLGMIAGLRLYAVLMAAAEPVEGGS
jgi:hypothetical protein